jgi:hypothetical protein
MGISLLEVALLVLVGILLVRLFGSWVVKSARRGEWANGFSFFMVFGLCCLFVLLGSFLLFGIPHPGLFIIIVASALMLVLAWFRELMTLMSLSDDVFPGRHDKVIWAFLLIVMPPLGAIAFWSFRRAYWPAEKSARAKLHRELS